MLADVQINSLLVTILLFYGLIAISCCITFLRRIYSAFQRNEPVLAYWERKSVPWTWVGIVFGCLIFFVGYEIIFTNLIIKPNFSKAEIESVEKLTNQLAKDFQNITEQNAEAIKQNLEETEKSSNENSDHDEPLTYEQLENSEPEAPQIIRTDQEKEDNEALSLTSLSDTLTDEEKSLIDRFNLYLLISVNLSRYFMVGSTILLFYFLYRISFLDIGLQFIYIFTQFKLGVFCLLAYLPFFLIITLISSQFFDNEPHSFIVPFLISDSVTLLILLSFTAIITAPLAEEFLFRVILQGWLEKQEVYFKDLGVSKLFGPGAVPILISASLFAIVHFSVPNSVIPIFFLGLFMGYIYRQTHSIWPSFALHFCFNAQTIIVLIFQKFAG